MNAAAYYREKAAEARERAARFLNREFEADFLKLAEEYELLAKELEETAAGASPGRMERP
jgi:hypothetical protein